MADLLEGVPYTGERLPRTIALGQKIMDEWGTKLLLIKMARQIKADAGASDKLQEASAVKNWIESRVKYISDPYRAEMVGDPLWTIEHGGDCDDMASLAGALLQALGHKTSFASVQWKGRAYPSHAVCLDWTAGAVVDPVAHVDTEQWPPEGYEVAKMFYQDEHGAVASLDGFFSKAFKKINKTFRKVFKPKTLLGKIADPFGLSSRNEKLGGRIADVVGTAALLATGAYAVGVAGGATGGFWATAGQGASMVGGGIASGAKAAAAWAGKSALGKSLVTTLVLKSLSGAKQPQGVKESAYPSGGVEYAGGGGYGGGGEYSGGGGGGGSFAGYDQTGNPVFTRQESIPSWAPLAVGGLLVGALIFSRGKNV